MKKILKISAILTVAVTLLTGCDKDSEDRSTISTIPELTVLGDPIVSLRLGGSYTDQGCTAECEGQDISNTITMRSTINPIVPGFYKVIYTARNADGAAGTATRTVMVCDPNNFASPYFGESTYGTRNYKNAPITITDLGDNLYEIDDLAGGFYFNGRYPGYEPTYDFHLEATLKLNEDNTIELDECDGANWYWGDGMTLTEGKYDPATGTVTLILDFGGKPLNVTLTK